MGILRLTLYHNWFSLIARQEKKTEYRKRKPYWDKRLEEKEYDEIHFTNGYGADRPFMRLECKGIRIIDGWYAIDLGKVLEIRNYHQ